MSWKQTLYPNLDDKKLVVYYKGKPLTDWFLWCLAVAQKTFNVAPFAESAQIAWSWNNTKHQDRNLPDGCFVPIWWTGGYKNYGHVAVAKRTGNRIQIWSSPYTRKPFFDYFEGELNITIDTISRIYGVSYAGWTETMNTTRIVEWVNPPQLKSNEEIVAEIWQKKWGDGEERKRRLAAAGYSWDAIQSLVDKSLLRHRKNHQSNRNNQLSHLNQNQCQKHLMKIHKKRRDKWKRTKRKILTRTSRKPKKRKKL